MNLIFILATATTALYGLLNGFNGLTLALWIITALTGIYTFICNQRRSPLEKTK